MHSFSAQIDYYLEMYRRGDIDNAFHGLLETDHEILPELMQVYRRERDVDVREFLIKIIWEHRDPSIVRFLGEVLTENEPGVWREALNGLVSLASPDALQILQSARTRVCSAKRESEEFHRWLEEAIEQATSTIENGILPSQRNDRK